MRQKSVVKKDKTNANLDYWSKEEQLTLLEGWARDGYTNAEIAAKMGISEVTLQSYRKKHPEIDKAIRIGKEVIDYRVESALLRSALGATTNEVKVVQVYKKGELIETHKEVTKTEHVPSVLACTTWLFNRQREKWKKNRDNEITVDDDQSINITITRAGNSIEVKEDGNESDR